VLTALLMLYCLSFFSFCSAYKLAYKCIEIISEVGAFKQNRYITIFFYFSGWRAKLSTDFFKRYMQVWINHWANRANARGLTLLGASRSDIKALLCWFFIVRLFTTRQNCRAFLLLRLVDGSGKLITLAFIVFEWLKRIEPNNTTLFMTKN